MSDEFKLLLGGIRTRQLAKLIAEKVEGKSNLKNRVEKILKKCGLEPKKGKKESSEEDENKGSELSKMLIYTTKEAIAEMAKLLQNGEGKTDEQLAEEFGALISKRIAVPDMALCGRMLETGILKNTNVEAALQAAHAISTHEARPEVDYYVTVDDVPGEDAGAAYLDEAMFASACFYKYFSIDWEQLKANLKGFGEGHDKLTAHTVGAFIRGAAYTNPSGKQNSYAANNPPDGILIEIRDGTPFSYANAFAKPVSKGERDIIEQSVAQLGQYVNDLDNGYGKPAQRFWFSPNLRYPLEAQIEEEYIDGKGETKKKMKEIHLTDNNIKSLDELIASVIKTLGYDWEEVKQIAVNQLETI